MPILSPEELELLNAGNGWPLTMKCSFIEPGIVRYADVGDVLVKKETLDKMLNSFIGKPVVNEDHRDVTPEDFTKGTAQGIVNSVWFDEKDAMFHAAYQVWDKPTLQNIKGGYKVSCAYKVLRWGPGGVHNNVPYEREVLDGEYTHLAIVSNPRYEGVRIYNSKGAKTMTLKWIKKLLGTDGKELENAVEIESSKSIVEVDGKEYTLDNAIEALKAQEAAKAKELENKAPTDDQEIDVPGLGKRTVKQLRDAIALKNASEKSDADKKKADDDKAEADRKNAAEKVQLENAHKAGDHDGKEMANCASCAAAKDLENKNHFKRVEELANNREGELANELPQPFDGFAEGKKRFGSEPATADKK